MLVIFNIFQTFGYYGFANWVPTLLVRQGVTVTTSLLYSFIIAIAAPIGPMIGLLIADKLERRTAIVFCAGIITALGVLFSQISNAVFLIMIGVGLTLANNIMSYSFHAYQTELYPTSIRARAVGFVYSWSRLSAIFTSFFIAAVLKGFGTTGVFLSIGGAMLIVMVAVGFLGPNTLDLALEQISQD
jgi:MFS transporter, putative metabolite:H+ symporter